MLEILRTRQVKSHKSFTDDERDLHGQHSTNTGSSMMMPTISFSQLHGLSWKNGYLDWCGAGSQTFGKRYRANSIPLIHSRK